MPLRVSDYMSEKVVVVYPNDTLARARNLMLHHDISRLVVVDENFKPIGMVTETDIAKALLDESVRDSPRPIDGILVSEVMVSPIVFIGPRAYLKNAAMLMIKGGFSGLPVVESNGNLIGIITKTDIVRAYAEHYSGVCKVGEIMSSPVITVNPLHSIHRIGKL
ncbi:MAG: CBS domain-containing protein, partial [Candidatus Methanomethylicia archaeon]